MLELETTGHQDKNCLNFGYREKHVYNSKSRSTNHSEYFGGLRVNCLQSLEDLKKTCDKLGLKFIDYSETTLKVDMILDDKVVKRQMFYLVKWQGQDSKHNSWEQENRLTECEDLIYYYQALKHPPTFVTKEMVLHFIMDLVTRKPRDILTLTKLCSLVYRTTEEYISSLNLSFADLRTKAVKVLDIPIKKLNKIKDNLLSLMKFSEARKIVLLSLKEWEIKINAHTELYIKVENNVDLEGPPREFQFITNYISSCIELSEHPIIYCSCDDCYGNKDSCCSHNLDGQFAYNEEQCLQLPEGYPIYECNSLCKCDKNCINRVVQRGEKVRVAIFRTGNGCGWGLKALDSIKKGQFVLEYLGEIITTDLAETRGEVYDYLGRTYLFDLDWSKDCMYAVDSMLFGNASHFLNHSCEPNLETYTVWINHQNPYLPRLAFFAKRNIKPGQELTFDYKMADSRAKDGNPIPEAERILCKCNSKNCKKYLY